MSRRLRLLLAVVGLAVICLSCAALAYAFAPAQRATEQVPVAPTLFAPPQSLTIEWGIG